MRKILFALFFPGFLTLNAQAPEKWSSAEIYSEIEKLNFLGSVLYVAAHPDDENTRLISHFSNEVNARTAYLSLTRGDGGQNLIGPELREQLGMIRTQELLAARKIDGGEQFFTRANDFGYSKTPQETLDIWDKKEVLSDVVWILRKFRPDVVINRFDHRTPGTTHGHHTSSAMLSVEAFKLAGDPASYQDQLSLVEAFQPKRLFFNTSPWFYGSDAAFEKADKSNFLTLDTGSYFPLKGLSNPEIASLSRSEHKSQGFGSTGSRGKQLEYIELIEGSLPEGTNIFQGIDTSWNRLQEGAKIGAILQKVQTNFDFEQPSKSIPQLLEAYALIKELEDRHWREIKAAQLEQIIYACSGLFLEAVANKAKVTPSEEITITLEAINRSESKVKLLSVEVAPNKANVSPQVSLDSNISWDHTMQIKLSEKAGLTNPYWLQTKGTMGMYSVPDQHLRGLPEAASQNRAIFQLEINEHPITFSRPIIFKLNDAVEGEVYKNLTIVPTAELRLKDDILVFSSSNSKNSQLTVQANKPYLQGNLKLKVPDTWRVEPNEFEVDIAAEGGTQTFKFSIIPPVAQSEVAMQATLITPTEELEQHVETITYDHIPEQHLVEKATLELVKLDIQKKGELVGYIPGAGDIVPEAIEQMGYRVDILDPATITSQSLKKYDAVILGIRAFNIIQELEFKNRELFSYVEAGGNVIVQYNTNRGLVTNNLAPYELELSRDRVTNENAEVHFDLPEHDILNTPNKITKQDFKNWVQERGLYFANSWSPQFEAPLRMQDAMEDPSSGSLLVAKYGEGYYIYTGLSFFRQFPEALPGAYRLFANMISIGK